MTTITTETNTNSEIEECLLKPWPDHTQLPDANGTFVKNFQEHPQSILLTTSIRPILENLHPDGQYCIGQDCGIYWRLPETPEPLEKGAVSPDWFYVANVPPTLNGQMRRSYVMWKELIAPFIILEFVSGDGREERDVTPYQGKFWVYERIIRPAFYGIYEVTKSRLEVYRHVEDQFQLMSPNERGNYPIPPLGIEVGIWPGIYQGVELPWLRFWQENGNLLLAAEERAEIAQQEVAKERQARIDAELKIQELEARLRELENR